MPPTELPKAKLPHVSLELEVRPLAAAGLIFHLGQPQATPYVQLQVLTEQVNRKGFWVVSLPLWPLLGRT